MSYVIGGLIIVAIFATIFTLYAKMDGWKATLGIFAIALLVTAIFAFAAMLLTGAIKF